MARRRGVEMRERHRFQLPWSVEEQEACFLVRDHSGQALAYVYFEEEPGRRVGDFPVLFRPIQSWRTKLLAAKLAGQPTPLKSAIPPIAVRDGDSFSANSG
jgi:hypothetical protein